MIQAIPAKPSLRECVRARQIALFRFVRRCVTLRPGSGAGTHGVAQGKGVTHESAHQV